MQDFLHSGGYFFAAKERTRLISTNMLHCLSGTAFALINTVDALGIKKATKDIYEDTHYYRLICLVRSSLKGDCGRQWPQGIVARVLSVGGLGCRLSGRAQSK